MCAQFFFYIDNLLFPSSWTYKTKEFDIGFAVLFEDNSEVYKYEKLTWNWNTSNANGTPKNEQREGMILCERIGKCKFLLANWPRTRICLLHTNIM